VKSQQKPVADFQSLCSGCHSMGEAPAAMGKALAIVTNYDQLLQAIRARRDALLITHATIDVLSGLPDGYASKLLCDPPMKHCGAVSLGPVLGVLGLRLVVEVDDEALAKIQSRLVKRKRPLRPKRQAAATRAAVTA
jgi:hypothetical protein